MHAGIGATGAGEVDRLAHDGGDGVGQLAHHGAHAGVGREAAETTPVVRDGQASAPHLGQGMAVRIASFNVENLFQRARALDLGSWTAGRPILEAHAQLNTLFAEAVYTPARKQRILDLLDQLGLLHADLAEFAILRVIRGQLVVRHRDGTVEVVADGRADWVGWVDLTREPADELALRHTAMVVRDVAADVLGVVEAEDRTTLQRFNEQLLRDVGGTPYEQVMLVDGNDDRGIDVGIFVRAPLVDRAHPHPRVRRRRRRRRVLPGLLRVPPHRTGRSARRARQPLQVEGLQRAR